MPVYVHTGDAVRARTSYLQQKEAEDGDVLPLPGSPVVIGMPGHSPGSIAVQVPTCEATFVGTRSRPATS